MHPDHKRPRDLNRLAASIVGAVTDEDLTVEGQADERPEPQREPREHPRECVEVDKDRAGQ